MAVRGTNGLCTIEDAIDVVEQPQRSEIQGQVVFKALDDGSCGSVRGHISALSMTSRYC